MMKVKTVWYGYVVTVTINVICRKHVSDVGDDMY